VDLNQNFTSLDNAALSAYAIEVRAAFDALAEIDDPTIEQITEAEELADHLDALGAETDKRAEVEADRQTRAAALRTRFTENVEEPAATEDELADDTDDDEDEPDEVGGSPTEQSGGVAVLATKVTRPAKPVPARTPVLITAAADVPEFSTGSKIEDMDVVGTALVNRMRGFGTPSGSDNGDNPNWQHYGVATFKLDFPEELTIGRGSDDMQVLTYAANESRLPGGSLTAAGGWCAPSEVIYDLCPGASTDGMLSISEVAVNRGGIRYTRGPDFSSVYAAGFCQTEAEAIAGTTKPCYTVTCPPFVEVRLDVCGICIRVPILTNAAYPELISATLREAMIGHQHAMNARVLAAIATFAGTPVAFGGLGAASSDTLEALLLMGANMRQKYRLPMNQSLEVVLPFWARSVIQADLFRRTGCCTLPSQQDVNAIFTAAQMNVQFVYDWEELPDNATDWPTTIPALVYPAGAYIKGTSNVINLNAVYDAASLATNVYTGLFFEEGILVAEMCRDGIAVDIPVCTAGRTGANDLTCATTP